MTTLGRAPAAVVNVAASVLVSFVAAMTFWALAPSALGWDRATIVSGSMEPAISTGDVVVHSDPGTHELRRGNVITFRDPARPGRLLTHRIAWMRPDGKIVTRGDANAANDSTEIRREDVVGIGRLVLPGIGLPIAYARNEQPAKAVVLVAAVLLAGQVVATGWGKPETPAGPFARHRRGKGTHRASAGIPRIARPSTARHALGRPVPAPVVGAVVPAPRLPVDAPVAVPA